MMISIGNEQANGLYCPTPLDPKQAITADSPRPNRESHVRNDLAARRSPRTLRPACAGPICRGLSRPTPRA